jgi:hypothetical protein
MGVLGTVELLFVVIVISLTGLLTTTGVVDITVSATTGAVTCISPKVWLAVWFNIT